jgi:hypothetical protein
MPYVFKDRVKVTSTTTGTGTFTLGSAVAGFQDFSAIALSAPWNVSTSTYFQAFSVAAQDTAPSGIFFKPDGTKMYVSGDTGNNVYEYDLSTAWNVSTASYLQSFSVAGQTTNPASPFFKTDGTKMYVLNRTALTDSVLEYALSSAWDISTATYSQAFSVASQETNPLGLFISDDGLKMYVTGDVGDDVNEYTLSVAWDISTATYVRIFSVAAQETGPSGIFFKTDGTEMYIVGRGQDTVFQYSLSTAWNISTASYSKYFSIGGFEGDVQGLHFKPDGMKMYVVGYANDLVLEFDLGLTQTYYCITNGTDWEVGVGTTPYPGTTLIRSTVLESSNSNALVDWGAGTKTVFVTYPVEATEGSVPKADNSSVGTDLYAWTNLKKELNRGVVNGTPFNNNGTAGMVSTYSLVYTTTSSYTGGVLAPNGDVHFVPYSAAVGQKISTVGIVSTYALVYTRDSAYAGGVLASNGDIHFVPYLAVVGQKINASGVVSTYSLVNTQTQGAYAGGVLAPNGDIHFIPLTGNVGQKVSAAGVVSTYSLVHTTPSAYFGGVLASNGDIHFVPYTARVGQKISAAGVVSTYSLVTTTSFAYKGGVLAPNGDIHFVPNSARRGQKVSASGVVSTYSLAYTTTTAYGGGVLAPNGDIHFISEQAIVGQKISSAGVLSTYSVLLPGAGTNYEGGVLNLSGEIVCVGRSIGQKISTNTTIPIGYALSPFFNKF